MRADALEIEGNADTVGGRGAPEGVKLQRGFTGHGDVPYLLETGFSPDSRSDGPCFEQNSRRSNRDQPVASGPGASWHKCYCDPRAAQNRDPIMERCNHSWALRGPHRFRLRGEPKVFGDPRKGGRPARATVTGRSTTLSLPEEASSPPESGV